MFSLLELSTLNPPPMCPAFALSYPSLSVTVAFSALNVPCFYFKRTWQSVPSQGEQGSAKPTSLPHACFEPNAKVPPRVRHIASVLTVLSKVPDSKQVEVFHSFLLALHLNQALTQLLLSPRCLCLPAELRVNLQLLWLIVSICKEGGESFAVFSTRGAMPGAASRAGRGLKTQENLLGL